MAEPRVILLVDDDGDFVEMNRHVLEAAGYAVVAASNRPEALARLAESKIDLVITDLMMGELNSGFSLAAAIKGDAKLCRLPVILATSAARQAGYDFSPRSAADLAHMNADAFFEKPLRPAELLAKVAELLGTP